MRVLMLTWEYPPRIVGGISRVVHDLAHKIGEKGIEVHIVTLWESDMKEIERENENVYVHRVPNYEILSNDFINWVNHMNMAFIEYSIRLINDYGKFDLIHAHDWIVSFAAKVLKHSYFIPVVSTIHATEYGRNRGVHSELHRYIHNKEWWLVFESWKIIVNSNYMRNEVQRVFYVPDDKINVIQNGVDINKYAMYQKDEQYREKFASKDEKIIFFVGRVVNEKGISVLVEAAPKVLQNYKAAKFVIVGKGPELENLKDKVGWMGLEKKIIFTGYMDDESLNKLYKCVDIAVFPSLYEPFGIVVLEGIMAGASVVVSDIGGPSEIISHEYDGMKAVCGDPNSLADNILKILWNPEKAEQMRERAVKKVNDIYNWDIIAVNTIKVYERILEEAKVANWVVPNIKDQIGLLGKK